MSDHDNSSETSTFEMKTEKNFDKILNSISDMRQDFSYRFDGLEKRVENIETEQAKMNKFMNAQFEAIRQGLVRNYNQFDRIVSEVSQNRAAIFSMKAELGEFQERFYLFTKSTERSF